MPLAKTGNHVEVKAMSEGNRPENKPELAPEQILDGRRAMAALAAFGVGTAQLTRVLRLQVTGPALLAVTAETVLGVALFAVLAGNAAGEGAVNWLPARDQIVRTVPLLVTAGGTLAPSLSLEALRTALGETTVFVRASGGSVNVAKLARILKVPVVPIVASAAEMAQRFAVLGSAQTEVSVVVIERGPASIESQFEAALAVPEVLVAVRDAAAEGVDALIIDCMDDPGVGAARELVSIPVLGPAQTAMHLACLLARRFSIVAPEASAAATTAFEEQARHYGLREQLASVRGVDMPVLELRRDGELIVIDSPAELPEPTRPQVLLHPPWRAKCCCTGTSSVSSVCCWSLPPMWRCGFPLS